MRRIGVRISHLSSSSNFSVNLDSLLDYAFNSFKLSGLEIVDSLVHLGFRLLARPHHFITLSLSQGIVALRILLEFALGLHGSSRSILESVLKPRN